MTVGARLLDRLEGHARENARVFREDPRELASFMAALRSGRFRYAVDRVACPTYGERGDCFYSWPALRARDGEAGPWWADCADLVGMLAGAALVRAEPIAIGVIVNPKVSHAILGLPDATGAIGIGDPSVWYGMPHMRRSDYERAEFRRLN